MGPDRYGVRDTKALHFLSATLVQSLSPISQPANVQLLPDSLALPSARSVTGSMPWSIQCCWEPSAPSAAV